MTRPRMPADTPGLVCPACDGETLDGFHDVDRVPVTSRVLLDDLLKARSFPRGRLDLAICHDCGFITNRSHGAERTETSGWHAGPQPHSSEFRDSGRALAKTWVDDYDLHGKHVLEIGCGEGEFLRWMIEAGAGTATGVDPSLRPERLDHPPATRIDWIADVYDERSAHLHAAAIVCRHTLQHISPVGDFLRTLRANIGDRCGTVALFEVPDTLRILRDGACWDLHYEHCSYFTLDSLERLFSSSGFQVLSRSYVADDQSLLVEAVPATSSGRSRASDRQRDEVVTLARRFGLEMRRVIDSWDVRLRDVRHRGGRVALWGAGPQAVAVLSALKDPSLVDVVVDVDPDRQGKYIAGTGHLVLSPAGLVEVVPDLVVSMDPAHLEQIRQALDDLGLAGSRVRAV